MAEEVKKRGRPKGKNRRPEHKWDPKEWHPTYDLVVILSLTKSNEEIASIVNYSPQTVSNILTSPTGKIKKAEVLQMGRDKLAGTLENRARQMSDLAISRLHEILTDDNRMRKDATAFGAIDRALAVAKTFTPELKKDPINSLTPMVVNGDVHHTQVQNQQNIFTPLQAQEISEGLEKLQEVKKLHASK